MIITLHSGYTDYAPKSLRKSRIQSIFQTLGFRSRSHLDYRNNQLVSNYRDLALIKALYWRLFGLFRWVLFNTESTCAQSPIYSALREHVNSTDEARVLLYVTFRAAGADGAPCTEG